LLGLVFTLAASVIPAMPSVVPAMPSASVTCPGWPASCDGAWGAVAADGATDAPTQAGTDDGPRDYATPVEVDCPSPPEAPAQAWVASGECSEPPLNLWYRVSRFPDSEQPTGSLAPAPRGARSNRGISAGGPQDVGHWSAPDLQPVALFALPCLVPTAARNHLDVSSRTVPARAIAPPDRPPRA
jgi:hypothetical protein